MEQKKILIIEDDEFLREFYQELLASEGFLVDIAADGEVGLTKLQQGGWSFVLLDIMLPKMDGIEILRQVKTQGTKEKNGPIVMLTNLGTDSVVNQAFSLGASGYLIKSAMNPDQVLSEIHTFLQKTP